MKGLIELVITVAVAVALALLIQAFIVKPYRIPSPSMVPTLDVGQRVLTNRLAGNPSLGDIIVFHPPHGADLGDGVCGNPNQGGGHNQACDTPTAQESQ
ncbi:MAG: S26 family signal peptidase, partial [Solirubrobacterales bacterium]|nr:S26 family signal peptidase [Solirubrobacterales bacterium]